jgi:lysophospholipase L1-like esterase
MTLPTSSRPSGAATQTLSKALIGAALAGSLLLSACSSFDAVPARTHATWAASPSDYNAVPTTTGIVPPPMTFTNQTLRHTMQISLGGDRVRVRFSNVFGPQALPIAGARVARSIDGASTDPATDARLTVAGQPSFTVPAGSEVWSDPVALPVPATANLAVSVHVASATPAATYHALGRQTTHVLPGDQLAAAMPSGGSTQQSYHWVNGIDVYRTTRANVVVAFGDSITDGFNSTVDASRRYPNVLARRFAADASASPVSVVNAGISGNRVLNDTAGPKGIDRFVRDVLGQSGVTHTIILLGINDLGYCGRFGPAHCVSPDQVIAGLSTMVAQAKSRGVKLHLATLTPFKGTTFPGYYNDAAEAKRQAINAWIRNHAGIDGIVDFDKALQDPADPLRLLPALDSGDHLHPNDAGYDAMARAVDLARFR